jgi:hypothetical protein
MGRSPSLVRRAISLEFSVNLEKSLRIFGELDGVDWAHYNPIGRELLVHMEDCDGTFIVRNCALDGKTSIIHEGPLEEEGEECQGLAKTVENSMFFLGSFLTYYCK